MSFYSSTIENNRTVMSSPLDRLISNTTQTSMLYTLPVFDDIFDAVATDKITRGMNSQVNDEIEIDTNNFGEYFNAQDGEGNLTVPHCHVMSLLAFTSGSSEEVSPLAIERSSAVALGIQHLNTGNSDIVREWGNIRQAMCSDLVFTLEFMNSRDDAGEAVSTVVNATERSIPEYGYRTPCSFLGVARSEITIPTALMTGYKGYMDVSGSSTAFQLDNKEQYPNFVRTIPNDQYNVIPVLTYFVEELGLKYLAVVHMNEAYGNSFTDALIREGQRNYPGFTIRRTSVVSSGGTFTSSLENLKAFRFMYILAVMPNMESYNNLLEDAFHLGMVGAEGYQWYFSDSFAFIRSNVTESKALRTMYNGTGAFRPSAGRRHNNTDYDTFVKQLKDLSESPKDIDYLFSIIPGNNGTAVLGQYFHDEADLDYVGHDTAAFLYDAAMAMGMSACLALGDSVNRRAFGANEQFESLTDRLKSFGGATGDVEINDIGSRTYNSTFYDLNNYLIEEQIDDETGDTVVNARFITTDSYYNGTWESDEGVQFVFGNGELLHPDELTRPTSDNNATPVYMKALALLFSALSMLLAIVSGIWTWCNKSIRVIQASQPFFLYLICFGVFMVGSSIIPYSMDDSKFSTELCSRACTSFLWLFFSGLSIIFSALYTKTYRINLIMKNSQKFRRIKVTIRETMTTMGVMLLLNIITLSVMTAVDPPQYIRMVMSTDAFDRPSSTYGTCSWENQQPYLYTLTIINLLIVCLAAYQSWEARKLSTEFAESKYIFSALLITLALFMIGLPVIVMTRQIPKISVFTLSAAVFIFCMTILGLIFVPKIRFHYFKKDKKRTVIGGLNPSYVPSTHGRHSSTSGEKILTVQSASSLAKQVAELQRLLNEKEEEQKACTCTCKMGDPETIPEIVDP